MIYSTVSYKMYKCIASFKQSPPRYVSKATTTVIVSIVTKLGSLYENGINVYNNAYFKLTKNPKRRARRRMELKRDKRTAITALHCSLANPSFTNFSTLKHTCLYILSTGSNQSPAYCRAVVSFFVCFFALVDLLCQALSRFSSRSIGLSH